MQLRKSFFNKQLIRSDWRHYWPLLFSYVFVWFFVLPLHIRSMKNSYLFREFGSEYAVKSAIYDGMNNSVFMSAIWGCFFAMVVFSYLMKSSSTGMMHSLPLTRKTHYASHMLSAVTMMSAGNFITWIFALLMQIPYGTVFIKEMLLWLLITELVNLLFFTFAAMCAHMTGWLLAVPVIYAGLNCTCIVFVSLVQNIASEIYYGFSNLQIPELVKWFTPVYKTYYTLTRMNYPADGVQRDVVIMLCVYTAVAVGFCFAGYALYKHRKSETASDPIVFPWLKPVALYVITFCSALVLGILVQSFTGRDDWRLLTIYEIVCGLVIYFAVLMLLRKAFAVFDRRGLLGAAIVPAAIILLMLGIRMDVTGYQKYIPATDTVGGVSIHTRSFEYGGSDEDMINRIACIHSEVLRQWENGETNTRHDDDWYWEDILRIDYTKKDGSVVSRSYYTCVNEGSELDHLLSELLNQPEVRSQRLKSLKDMLTTDEIIGGYVELYRDDGYEGFNRQLSKEEADLIYQAMQMDAMTQGTLAYTDFPTDCRLYLQIDISNKQSLIQSAEGLFPATSENSWSFYSVRPDDEHLIETLKKLQIIDSVEELYYSGEFAKFAQ